MTVNVRLCAPTCAFLLFLVYAECHGMRNVTQRLCPRAEVRDLRGKRVPVDGGPKRRSVRRVSSAMPAVRVWEQGIADEPGAGRNKRGNVPWGSTFLQRTNQPVRSQVTDTDGTSRRADERRRACRKERMMMSMVMNMMMNMKMVVALEVDGRGLPRGLPVCRRSAMLTRAT